MSDLVKLRSILNNSGLQRENNALYQVINEIISTVITLTSDLAQIIQYGQWIPILGGSVSANASTYSIQIGSYIKIGQLVIASYTIALSAFGGALVGSAEIQNLPFASIADGTNDNINIVQFSGLNTNWIHIINVVLAGKMVARVRGNNAAAAANTTDLVNGDFTNATVLVGVLIYQSND